MYYINSFFVYSVLGYFFETIVSKITGKRFESGIMYGPITPIYGIGVVIILIVSKYLFINLHMPRWFETLIVFFSLIIILTLMEFIGGILIEKLFGIVFWDYSHLKWNIGKYISLEISLVWGFLSIFLIYVIKPLLDKFVVKIPTFITYSLIIIFIVDMVFTFIKYKKI